MSKMQAYESFQRFGKMFPGLLEAFQAWAEIGSLEQASAEQRSKLEQLRTATEAQGKALADLTGQVGEAQLAADRHIAAKQADIDAREKEIAASIAKHSQTLADINNEIAAARKELGRVTGLHSELLAKIGARER